MKYVVTAAASQGNVQRAQQGIDQLYAQLTTKKQHLNSLLSQATTLMANMDNAAIAASAVGGAPGVFITSAAYNGPTNTAAGKWFLYGGAICAAIGAAASFRLRPRRPDGDRPPGLRL